jgi:DNA-binding CsgD family transcriptional regulator
MSEPHPSPVVYYFHILKALQNFSELFPTKARHLIKEATKKPIKRRVSVKDANRNFFFLPTRSARFYIGEDVNKYITTYEALCVQLMQEGKSYKEIGTILSMASSTVKTHLNRLKERTGLSLQEVSLQSFQKLDNSTSVFNLEHDKERKNKKTTEPKKLERG